MAYANRRFTPGVRRPVPLRRNPTAQNRTTRTGTPLFRQRVVNNYGSLAYRPYKPKPKPHDLLTFSPPTTPFVPSTTPPTFHVPTSVADLEDIMDHLDNFSKDEIDFYWNEPSFRKIRHALSTAARAVSYVPGIEVKTPGQMYKKVYHKNPPKTPRKYRR